MKTHVHTVKEIERGKENTHIGAVDGSGCRVAVAAAVVLLLTVGLQGRVARVLEEAWLQAGDLALAGGVLNCCSLLLSLPWALLLAGVAVGAHGQKTGQRRSCHGLLDLGAGTAELLDALLLLLPTMAGGAVWPACALDLLPGWGKGTAGAGLLAA